MTVHTRLAVRDFAIVVVTALLGALLPVANKGLEHSTLADLWSVLDAVALSLVVQGTLYFTSLTRSYGVGSADPPLRVPPTAPVPGSAVA